MNFKTFTVMRQKNSPTILERAVNAVPEFEKVMTKLSNQVTLKGQRKSTLFNAVITKFQLLGSLL